LTREKTAQHSSKNNNTFSKADAPKFMLLCFISCNVGLIFQVIFHVGTRENQITPKLTKQARQEAVDDDCIAPDTSFFSNSLEPKLNWLSYLKSFRFYNIAVLFMCTRLIINMTQVYLPMYLTDTIYLDKVYTHILF
jgi:hypothetical protein